MAKGRIQSLREKKDTRTPEKQEEEKGFFGSIFDFFVGGDEEEPKEITEERTGRIKGRVERGIKSTENGRKEPDKDFFEDKGFGVSRRKDPASGRPLLRAPQTIPETATTPEFQVQLESPERVAVTFDPTKPQKLDREDVSRSGDRMTTTASQEIRNELGAGFDEELDHIIALALSGSNVEKNLEVIEKDLNRKFGKDELELMNKVVDGEISLLDAQLEMAKKKGIDLPESEDTLRQKIQNQALKLPPETLEKLESFQEFIKDPFKLFKTFSKAKKAKKRAERVAEEARQRGVRVNDPPETPGLTKAVSQQIVKNAPNLGGKTLEAADIVTDTFIPALKNWFIDSGNIIGEGIAYAVDPVVREEYQAGNLEVLPTITEKTPLTQIKHTIAAGIELAVYKSFPGFMKLNIYKRFGLGALEGLGFAISDGLAKDQSPEEIIESAKLYVPFGGAITVASPYIMPVLKAELKNVPKGVRSAFKQLNKELRGAKPSPRAVRKAAGTRTVKEITEDKAITRRAAERTLKEAEETGVGRVTASKAGGTKAGTRIIKAGETTRKTVPSATRILVEEVSGDITEKNIKTAIKSLETKAQKAGTTQEKGIIFQRIRAVREQGENVLGKKIKIEDDLNRVERVRTESVKQIAATRSVKETRRALRGLNVDETAVEGVVNKLSRISDEEGIKEIIRGLPRKTGQPTKPVFPAGLVSRKGARSALKREGYSTKQIKEILDNVDTTTRDGRKLIKGRDIATEAEKLPIPKKPKKPPAPEPKVGGEKFSSHFEKIKNELNGVGESVGINTMNIENEARKAFNYINKNPKKAMKIAYGFEKAPSRINEQALRMSMIQALKAQGKFAQARAIAKKLSLGFTKSAQELNIAKLDLSSAGARRIEATILSERLDSIGKKLPKELGETAKDRALNKISKDSKVAGKKVVKQSSKVRKADEILEQLIC